MNICMVKCKIIFYVLEVGTRDKISSFLNLNLLKVLFTYLIVKVCIKSVNYCELLKKSIGRGRSRGNS